MLKNYKKLKVWQKSYEFCLRIYRITEKFPKEERYGLSSQILLAGDLDLIEKRHRRNRKNVKGADKVFKKQTLGSLTPGILGPSSPINLEKNINI